MDASPNVGSGENGTALAIDDPDVEWVDDSAITLLADSERVPKALPRKSVSRYERGDTVAEKYRLVRMLGSGGMGAVWVAHHLDLDIQVALKLIRADVDDGGMGQRFLSEARLLARIEHRAVVRILDFGRTEQGDPFIVMELLRGEDLRSAIERYVQMPPTLAVSLLLPVAEGLAAAHSRQIVHRDLKPDNIFLAEVGRVRQPKILDFGIARCLAVHSDIHVTDSGCVVGSPEYMSPEQAQGCDDIDHRVDVWGFCSVLFECLTGQRPFLFEGSYEKLLRRIIDEPVPSLDTYGVHEPDLDAILQRGFEKHRDDRWQSIEELATALAEWLTTQGQAEDACGTSLRAAWLRPSMGCTEVQTLAENDSRRVVKAVRALRLRPKSSVAGLLALAVMGAVLFALKGPRAEASDAVVAVAPPVPAAVVPAPVRAPSVELDVASTRAETTSPPDPSISEKTPPASARTKNARRRVDNAHRAARAEARINSVPSSSAMPKREIETRDSVELFYENLGF